MIGIVILNYNTHEETAQLVKALQRQTIVRQLHIVVVDNASPNDSYTHLKPLETQYEQVYVLKTTQNEGYARGNNFGLKFLEEHIQPEYAAILNNDVVLPEDCFEKLEQKYQELNNPCMIAPVQRNAQGTIYALGKIATFRDDLLNLSLWYRLLRKRAPRLEDNTGKRAMKVETITGSFLFVRLERFKSIGYFYPETFLYTEERFIAHRSKQAGFNNYLVLDQEYLHGHGQSIHASVDRVTRYQYQYDGWIKFTRECRKFPTLKLILLKPLIRLSLLEIGLVGLFSKK